MTGPKDEDKRDPNAAWVDRMVDLWHREMNDPLFPEPKAEEDEKEKP